MAVWILTQMKRWGISRKTSTTRKSPSKVFCDGCEEVHGQIEMKAPAASYAQIQGDGKEFDASAPEKERQQRRLTRPKDTYEAFLMAKLARVLSGADASNSLPITLNLA